MHSQDYLWVVVEIPKKKKPHSRSHAKGCARGKTIEPQLRNRQ